MRVLHRLQLSPRRTLFLIINALFNHVTVFSLVGKLNSKRNFIYSVFLCYPASESYALAYVHKKHLQKLSWRPFISGIIKQNGKWTVVFAVSNSEDEFTKKENVSQLVLLVEKIESIRELLKAKQKSFAGVLPGLLFRNRIIMDTVERDVTVEAVIKAIVLVMEIENVSDVPLILLGSRGFIGRKLMRELSHIYSIYSIDIEIKNWPFFLKGQKCILINVSVKNALAEYYSFMWPGMIILNEVYPEPTMIELEQLKMLGCKVYHIAGIKGKAYPSFPGSYKAGIPCCAGVKSDNLKAVLSLLN